MITKLAAEIESLKKELRVYMDKFIRDRLTEDKRQRQIRRTKVC